MSVARSATGRARVATHFIGVDLLRGLAMFSVVVLHADEGVVTIPLAWERLTRVANFAVPFFLATAFYFAARSLYRRQGQFAWRTRLSRLLIPYAFWTGFYLLFRSSKYWLSDQSEKLTGQFQDPMGLLFLGSTTIHLYFLPLLIVGMMLVGLIGPVIVRSHLSRTYLWLLAGSSWLLYELLIFSGNDFQPLANAAFQAGLPALAETNNAILRLVTVGFAWGIRTLPYLFLGFCLANIPDSRWQRSGIRRWIIVIIGTGAIVGGDWLLPPAIGELVRGYGALLVALVLSPLLGTVSSAHSPHQKVLPASRGLPPIDKLLSNLGGCTFGIYLIHLLFVEIFQTVVHRRYPGFVNGASTGSLLLAAIGIFMLSWLVVYSLRQQPGIVRMKLL